MSDRRIIALTLGLNAVYLAGLFGFVALRLSSGLSPIPTGLGPFVFASTALAPIAFGWLGNFMRMRRNLHALRSE